MLFVTGVEQTAHSVTKISSVAARRVCVGRLLLESDESRHVCIVRRLLGTASIFFIVF